MKARLCAIGLCLAISIAASAAPNTDTPRGPIDRAISKIVRIVTKILHPLDDLTPPHP